MDTMLASETAAREEVVKVWPQFSDQEKIRCAQTARQGGSPSYIELLICLEMNRDARTRQQQLKDEQAKAKSLKPTPKP
jgi:hypothetical protein